MLTESQLVEVWLEDWILGDGSYGDFRVGETREFALELWIKQRHTAHQNEDSLRRIGPGLYDLCGSITFSREGLSVMDSGISFLLEETLGEQGQRVSIRTGIGIDYYQYFEFLYKDASIPPLTYEWRVEGILADITPLKRAGNFYIKDEEQEKLVPVSSTNRSESKILPAYDGTTPIHAGNFLLQCSLTGTAPRRGFSKRFDSSGWPKSTS